MKYITTIALGSLMLFPNISFAAMTQPQVDAICSVLVSFGVEQTLVDSVRAMLAPDATTSPVTYEVQTSPIVENQPVYFGSAPVAPVQPTAPTTTMSAPLVQAPVDNSGVFLTDVTDTFWSQDYKLQGVRHINIIVKDANGKILSDGSQTITLTVDGVPVQAGTRGDNQPVYDIELNQTGGKIYPITATPTSSVEVNYQGVVHSFTLDNL